MSDEERKIVLRVSHERGMGWLRDLPDFRDFTPEDDKVAPALYKAKSALTRAIPTGLAMALAWGYETAHRLAGNPREPRLTRFVVRELSTAHWFDISVARRDLGYAPGISIAEGLERLRVHLKHP